jgi:hypothetical protein
MRLLSSGQQFGAVGGMRVGLLDVGNRRTCS